MSLTWNDVAKKIALMTPEQREKNIISSIDDFRMIVSKACNDAYSAICEGTLTKDDMFNILDRINDFRSSLVVVDENDLIMTIEGVFKNILVGRLEKDIKVDDKVKVVTRLGVYTANIDMIHMYNRFFVQGKAGDALGIELRDIDKIDIRNGDKIYLES